MVNLLPICLDYRADDKLCNPFSLLDGVCLPGKVINHNTDLTPVVCINCPGRDYNAMFLVESGSASDLCLISLREGDVDTCVDECPVKGQEGDRLSIVGEVTSCRVLGLVFRQADFDRLKDKCLVLLNLDLDSYLSPFLFF